MPPKSVPVRGDDPAEGFVLGDLDGQFLALGAWRVQRSTLLLSGSPDATPSGYRSRRSFHFKLEGKAKALPHAADAPRAKAISRKDLRVRAIICQRSYRIEYCEKWVLEKSWLAPGIRTPISRSRIRCPIIIGLPVFALSPLLIMALIDSWLPVRDTGCHEMP